MPRNKRDLLRPPRLSGRGLAGRVSDLRLAGRPPEALLLAFQLVLQVFNSLGLVLDLLLLPERLGSTGLARGQK